MESLRAEFFPHEDYLDVRFIGTMETSLTVYRDVIQQMLGYCKANNCTRVLVDCSGVNAYTRNIMFEHNLGAMMAEAGFHGINIAVVAIEEAGPQAYHFENVTRNRGVNLQLFAGREEALRWLFADGKEQ